MKNVLMIGAHYDDVELGCGGTAYVLTSKGANVYKMTLTDNEFTDSVMGNIEITKKKSALSSEKSCNILGMKEVNLKYQSCYGKLMYHHKLMKEIEDFIMLHNVDSIFMHFDRDMHHDHIVAYDICKTAGRHCRNIFTYQSNGYIKDRTFSPVFFIDISDAIKMKEKALRIYEEDQEEQNRGGRLFDICIKQNEIYGYGNGVKYAEGFEVIKMMGEYQIE